jgi:flavin-dependent dehydrogenase
MAHVLVVGGGPAGSATALALRGTGVEVTLLERCATRVDRPGETLLADGARILRELGLLAEFQRLATRRCYLHRIHWGGRVAERSAILGTGPSHHLDRARFDAMLLQACRDRGADVLFGSLLELKVDAFGALARARVSGSGREWRCDAIVDATGRSASVARLAGARRERVDRLVALTATFERDDVEPSSLLESSTRGWWYTAPRPDGGLIAMYLSELTTGRREHAGVWQRALEEAPATRARLQGRARRTELAVCAAAPGFTHFDPTLALLPVGDAAASFDPLAGEGLCFALRSGIEAASALREPARRRAFYAATFRIHREHLRRREHSYARERALRAAPFWQRARDTSLRE